MPIEKDRKENGAGRPAIQGGEEAGRCDYCGRDSQAPLVWAAGCWLCTFCRLELDSCGCSD